MSNLIALNEDWDDDDENDVVILGELEDDELIKVIQLSLEILADRCNPYIDTLRKEPDDDED